MAGSKSKTNDVSLFLRKRPENLGCCCYKSWSSKAREPGILMFKKRRKVVYFSSRI
jgi:hypothetical protein